MNIPDLKDKVAASMTRDADVSRVIAASLLLAFPAALVTIPYFHYLVVAVPTGFSGTAHDKMIFLFLQTLLLFIILFLCSLIGFSFAKRLELPGLGEVKGYLRDLPLLIAGGIVLAAVTYLVYDRYLFIQYPSFFPKDTFYLMSLPFRVALVNETILRMGLVTIGVGVMRNRGVGVIIMAAIASLFTVKYFEYLGISFGITPLFIVHLLISFIGNLLLGWLFVTRGLLYSMTVAFVVGWKYLLIARIGG
jgi:hypothetical protein